MSDLASVFQLGAGVCLALSVFKEPISLAEDRVQARIRRDLALIPNNQFKGNEDKRQDILQKKAALKIAKIEAEGLVVWPKRLIWVGVVTNSALLFFSSLYPTIVVSERLGFGLLTVSILIYLIAIVWMSLIASAKIHSIVGK